MFIKQTIHSFFQKMADKTASFPNVASITHPIDTVQNDYDKLAPLISHMATTGEGTDACLELGCLPVPVHFYSPIPDVNELVQRDVWNQVSDLTGIDFDPQKQIGLLVKLGSEFGKECEWPLEKTRNPSNFYVNNYSFSYGCAAGLHSMIRYWQPKRLIEIGSGFSSRVISAAISQIKEEASNGSFEYTIVDPYPDEKSLGSLPNISQIQKKQVQVLDLAHFNELEENDILFIDSSHSVKIGSDVNYLILEILPKLASGVIIHFHDIPLPYEYPKIYLTNPAFRMFWTESYLLQAFLSFNDSFEILLGMAYLLSNHLEEFGQAFPHFNSQIHEASSGSFWIRKK